MPIQTPHYQLEAHVWGDYYSASVDKRRFTIIDNQMAFISDIIGNGKINGWNFSIKDQDARKITISPGSGLINRRIVSSFGNIDIVVDNDKTVYVYAKAKRENVGGFSSYSNITNITATIDNISDRALPVSPDNLIEIISLKTYNQLSFQWDANTEIDFNYFSVQKYIGDSNFGWKELTQTTSTTYIDTILEENTTYKYRVIAINMSGYESIPSEINLTTSLDTRIPIAPTFVQAFAGNEQIQVIWDHSASNNINNYKIEVQPLDANYNSDGDSRIIFVEPNLNLGFGSTYYIIEFLDNYKKYKITVSAVTQNNYESEGVSVTTEPKTIVGAGDVSNLDIEFEESDFTKIAIEANLTWQYFPPDINDPYFPTNFTEPEKFLITFIENGTRVSEYIEVLASSSIINYSKNIKLIPYKNTEGDIIYESIKQYTPYVIIIQTIDVNFVLSGGIITRINRTPYYGALGGVNNVEITRKGDNSVVISWENPQSQYFDYNLITCKIIDLASTNDETYVGDENIGTSQILIVPPSYFSINKRYDVTIIPIDIFGNQGITLHTAQQFVEEEETLIPDAPSSQQIEIGDKCLYLKWNPVQSNEIESYKIYRAINSIYLPANLFSLIGIVSVNNNYFTDFTVENYVTYAYFITSLDIYGNESPNPTTSNYVPNDLLIATPKKLYSISTPTEIHIERIGDFDAEIKWTDINNEDFDGYEIYRSIGNDYSFELISYVENTENSYLDENILLINSQTYYYMVRKYRNEMSLYVSELNVPPSDSIILASITTSTSPNIISTSDSEQIITIDDSLYRNLKNFEDPIRERTQVKVLLHHHTIDNYADRRIELTSDATVTDWLTFDFKVYNTTSDIEGATDYVIRIFGEVNEKYFTDKNGIKDLVSIKKAQDGLCPISYEVNQEEGKITFSNYLFTQCIEPEDPDPLNPNAGPLCPITPYVTEPTISLELVNIDEVKNILPENRIESIDATQLISGQLNNYQLPDIKHDGRIKEQLLPLRLPTRTLDNFVYSLTNIYTDDDKNKMGGSVAFYDIVETEVPNHLLAATSSGIWLSNDLGNTWSKKISFLTPVYKVYKSSLNKYYAITNYNIYVSNGIFSQWEEMKGLEYVKAIRNITEDSNNNLYISTNLGVFRLNSEDIPYIKDTWEQLSIFGVKSNESYGIIYDEDSDCILTSNELGILRSNNNGKSWYYISAIADLTKVITFTKQNNYIFALTNTEIYRKEDTETSFTKIAEIDASVSRFLVIFNDTIYISTDNGPKNSGTSNIYTETDIEFYSIWPKINIKNNQTIVTSLNLIDNNLLIGTDRYLFLFDDNNKIWTQYEQYETIIPSIYVNKVLQKLGVYYNNDNPYHNISFDEAVPPSSLVEISNKYNIYITEYKGWVEQKYDSKFKIKVNNILIGESIDNIQIDTAPFLSFIFPTFDTSNSYVLKADLYKNNIINNINILSSTNPPIGSELRDLISDTYKNFNMFLSQIYPSARVITVNGEIIPVSLPEININIVKRQPIISNTGEISYQENLIGATCNVVNGLITFDTHFSKYDNLIIDIFGCTVKNAGDLSHREIEDKMEIVNSGPPSSLSQVQQSNINKIGIFCEKKWNGLQKTLSPSYQSEYIIFREDNQYDTLNSTINYIEKIASKNIPLSLTYASTVLYIEENNTVLIGGKGGVLSINTETLNISEVIIDDLSNQYVKEIYRDNNLLYTITNANIYKSEDYGSSWTKISTNGLPNKLFSICSVYNNILVGASDGIYIQPSETSGWEQVISSLTPVKIMSSPDLLFAVIGEEKADYTYDDCIYSTSDGYNFNKLNIVKDFHINKIFKFSASIYVATNKGLYTDSMTFYSNNPALHGIDFEEDSSDLIVNDINSNYEKMAIGLSNGNYYIMENSNFDSGTYSSLEAIQKVLLINNTVWAFGYNLIRIMSLDYPVRF